MKTITSKLLAVTVLSTLAFAVVAAPECTQEPKDKWMSEQDMKAKIEADGYSIKRFLTSGSCYEIYGKNKNGKNVEIYFNPVDGTIVKQRGG